MLTKLTDNIRASAGTRQGTIVPCLRRNQAGGILLERGITELHHAQHVIKKNVAAAAVFPATVNDGHQFNFIASGIPRIDDELCQAVTEEMRRYCTRNNKNLGEEIWKSHIKTKFKRGIVQTAMGPQRGTFNYVHCGLLFFQCTTNEHDYLEHQIACNELCLQSGGELAVPLGNTFFLMARVCSPYVLPIMEIARSREYNWMLYHETVPLFLFKAMCIQKYEGKHFFTTQNSAETVKSWVELVGGVRMDGNGEETFVDLSTIPREVVVGRPVAVPTEPVRKRPRVTYNNEEGVTEEEEDEEVSENDKEV